MRGNAPQAIIGMRNAKAGALRYRQLGTGAACVAFVASFSACYSKVMLKFGFRIKTKSGAVVENLLIQAVDLMHAQARLLQMYPYATVLESKCIDEPARGESMDLESAISLIIGKES